MGEGEKKEREEGGRWGGAETFQANANGFNFNPRTMKNHWKYLSRRTDELWVPEF